MSSRTGVGFRAFTPEDVDACMALFDANCPAFFAPNERDEFAAFLASAPVGYEVCTLADTVAGAFGLIREGSALSLRWIMIDPARQGRGLGSAIMRRVREAALAGMEERVAAPDGADDRGPPTAMVRIAASHRSAPFFARFGAETVLETPDGWGPGMHRIDMELAVRPEAAP